MFTKSYGGIYGSCCKLCQVASLETFNIDFWKQLPSLAPSQNSITLSTSELVFTLLLQLWPVQLWFSAFTASSGTIRDLWKTPMPGFHLKGRFWFHWAEHGDLYKLPGASSTLSLRTMTKGFSSRTFLSFISQTTLSIMDWRYPYVETLTPQCDSIGRWGLRDINRFR